MRSSQFSAADRPAVVGRAPLPVDPEHRAHPHAAGVPPVFTRAEDRAAMGPVQAVRARVVLGGHAVLVHRHVERVDRGPEVPRPVHGDDHRVLDRVPLVAGQHRPAWRGGEPLGRVRLQHVDPPVLAARCRAADVQAPTAVGGPEQCGALQRLGAEPLLGHLGHGLDHDAVDGAGDDHGQPAALAERCPHPVGEVDHTVDEHRAGGTRPVARPVAGWLDGDGRVGEPGYGQERGGDGAGHAVSFRGVSVVPATPCAVRKSSRMPTDSSTGCSWAAMVRSGANGSSYGSSTPVSPEISPTRWRA